MNEDKELYFVLQSLQRQQEKPGISDHFYEYIERKIEYIKNRIQNRKSEKAVNTIRDSFKRENKAA